MAERVVASGKVTDHFRWRNKPALVTSSDKDSISASGSAMLLSSKLALTRFAGRFTVAARLSTNTPRARSSCTTDAALLSMPTAADGNRSEEHTSELQSQSNLVCRLLLEKK